MNIKLKHSFLKTCTDITGLFNNVVKINSFCSRLEKQADNAINSIIYDPNDYKGDGFELLIEALIKLSPADNRLGIFDYSIVDKSDDVGVDGYGVGIDGKACTVQVKYRSDNTVNLTSNNDHLANFASSSFIHYGVEPASNTNMVVFTTAKGLHYYTDENMFKNKVRCIGHNELRELLDNNYGFWNSLRTLIHEATYT
jgi:hypothetical protein